MESPDFHGGADCAGGNHRGYRALILYTRDCKGLVRRLNRLCSVVVGLDFAGVFAYLLANAVVPITAADAWRGIGNVIAVAFYLLGIVPLLGLTLVDLNVIGRGRTAHTRMAIHAGFVWHCS